MYNEYNIPIIRNIGNKLGARAKNATRKLKMPLTTVNEGQKIALRFKIKYI